MTDTSASAPAGSAGSAGSGLAPQPARPPRSARTVTLVLAVLAVVLLVLTTVLALRVRGEDGEGARVQAERAEVLGVARQQATNLTSLSSADFEAGLARVRALSTGAFLMDLDASLAPLRQQLASTTFTQRGTLLDAGVVEVDGDRAKTILALDQEVSSDARSRTDALRLQIDLIRTDGRWLVDNVIFQPDTVAATGASAAPNPIPTGGAQPSRSAAPSGAPSAAPTSAPTSAPSASPSALPSGSAP